MVYDARADITILDDEHVNATTPDVWPDVTPEDDGTMDVTNVAKQYRTPQFDPPRMVAVQIDTSYVIQILESAGGDSYAAVWDDTGRLQLYHITDPTDIHTIHYDRVVGLDGPWSWGDEPDEIGFAAPTYESLYTPQRNDAQRVVPADHATYMFQSLPDGIPTYGFGLAYANLFHPERLGYQTETWMFDWVPESWVGAESVWAITYDGGNLTATELHPYTSIGIIRANHTYVIERDAGWRPGANAGNALALTAEYLSGMGPGTGHNVWIHNMSLPRSHTSAVIDPTINGSKSLRDVVGGAEPAIPDHIGSWSERVVNEYVMARLQVGESPVWGELGRAVIDIRDDTHWAFMPQRAELLGGMIREMPAAYAKHWAPPVDHSTVDITFTNSGFAPANVGDINISYAGNVVIGTNVMMHPTHDAVWYVDAPAPYGGFVGSNGEYCPDYAHFTFDGSKTLAIGEEADVTILHTICTYESPWCGAACEYGEFWNGALPNVVKCDVISGECVYSSEPTGPAIITLESSSYNDTLVLSGVVKNFGDHTFQSVVLGELRAGSLLVTQSAVTDGWSVVEPHGSARLSGLESNGMVFYAGSVDLDSPVIASYGDDRLEWGGHGGVWQPPVGNTFRFAEIPSVGGASVSIDGLSVDEDDLVGIGPGESVQFRVEIRGAPGGIGVLDLDASVWSGAQPPYVTTRGGGASPEAYVVLIGISDGNHMISDAAYAAITRQK